MPSGATFGTVSSGGPPACAHCASQPGRTSTSGASRAIAFRSSLSGIHGLPQSRLCENVQSSVTISPTAPAAFARAIRAAICSRPPAQ